MEEEGEEGYDSVDDLLGKESSPKKTPAKPPVNPPEKPVKSQEQPKQEVK